MVFTWKVKELAIRRNPSFFFLFWKKKCLGYHYLNSFPSGGRVYNLLMVFHCTFAGSPDSQSTNRRNWERVEWSPKLLPERRIRRREERKKRKITFLSALSPPLMTTPSVSTLLKCALYHLPAFPQDCFVERIWSMIKMWEMYRPMGGGWGGEEGVKNDIVIQEAGMDILKDSCIKVFSERSVVISQVQVCLPFSLPSFPYPAPLLAFSGFLAQVGKKVRSLHDSLIAKKEKKMWESIILIFQRFSKFIHRIRVIVIFDQKFRLSAFSRDKIPDLPLKNLKVIFVLVCKNFEQMHLM